MKSIGYARVSTSGQSTDAQVSQLRDAGCVVVFQETVSTRLREKDRPQLQLALQSLVEGDELVVAKLDRLGRTQVEVVFRLHALQDQGIHIRTLDGLVNTRGLGKFAPILIGLLSGLAEVERSLIQERTLESIQLGPSFRKTFTRSINSSFVTGRCFSINLNRAIVEA